MEYFISEKHESIFFILIGLAAVFLSILIHLRFTTYRGMAIPLVLIALIQIAVGSTVYFRTDSQVEKLELKLKNETHVYKNEEAKRMNVVLNNFTIYKIIEIILLCAGIIITFIYKKNDLIYSAGIGLILQPTIMIVFDLLAEKRAAIYLDQIQSLLKYF